MEIFRRGTGSGPDGVVGGTECPPVAVADSGADLAPWQHVTAALVGLRAPIVLILLLIAFFTWISGKPLDGALLAVVATGLAWDTGRRRRGRDGGTAEAPAVAPASAGASARAGARRSRPLVALLVPSGVAYAAVVGSFSRYSWPATAGVIGLGAAVVGLGWRGPLRPRQVGALPPRTTLAWGALLVVGGLWELAALFQQPDLTTGSYAHPTISTLTDPLLASHLGRSVALGIWLALGWFLVER